MDVTLQGSTQDFSLGGGGDIIAEFSEASVLTFEG